MRRRCYVCRPQRGDRGDRPPRRFDGPPGGGGGYRESRFGSREGGGGFGRGGGDKVSTPLLCCTSTSITCSPCYSSDTSYDSALSCTMRVEHSGNDDSDLIWALLPLILPCGSKIGC